MVSITIYVDEKEVKKRLGSLAYKSGAVIARAANRSMTTGKKVIKQETAKIYNVRQMDVEAILKTTRATQYHPVATMTYKDVHQNLFAFGHTTSIRPRYIVRSSNPIAPDPEYVKAKVMKKTSPTPLEERPKPFVQRAATSGNIALFQRTTNASRAPLRGVAAPSLPQVIYSDEVITRFERDTYSMFTKRLSHEINNVLKGITR